MEQEKSSPIKEWESLLCEHAEFDEFEDLLEYLSRDTHVCKCQESWSKNQLSVTCLDCKILDNACVCLKCFLNGNHEGHSIIICTEALGNCDCGDPYQWKPTGFCKYHQTATKNESKIPSSISSILPQIFDSASTLLPKLILSGSTDEAIEVIDWLINFCEIGDLYRNLVVISLSKGTIFSDLIDAIFETTEEVISSLVDLLSLCINDAIFKFSFGYVYITRTLDMLNKNYQLLLSGDNQKVEPFLNLCFHFYKDYILLECVQRRNFDLVKCLLDQIEKYQNIKLSLVNNERFRESEIFSNYFNVFVGFIEVIKDENFKDYYQKLFNGLTDIFLDKSILYYTNIKEVKEKNIFFQYGEYNYYLRKLTQQMDKKENLEIDIISIINKFDDYYKSIYQNKQNLNVSLFNGCSICLFLIPYLLLKSLLLKLKGNVQNINNELLYLVSINVQRILLTNDIYNHQTSPGNFALEYFLSGLRTSDLFILMQMCIGFYQDKEKMINTIAHTIGIFDDDNEDKNDLIYFIFIHLISTLIFDRLEINLNKKEKVNQRLISKLLFKQKLFKPLHKIFESPSLAKIKIIKEHLDLISTSSPSLNGPMFKLKSKTLWDPLAPIYHSNKILAIYSKYISKYPNELMPFKPFLEEPFGMDLHSVLFSKTLLAIEYYILLCKNSQETNQLIINLLLTTSKFYTKTSNKTLENTIIYVNNIEELITKIPNDFESLMYQKYQFQNYSSKSFVDLIIELGKIGQNALLQMNITYEIPKKYETKTSNNNNKLNALKNSILSSFNTKIEQFENDNKNELDENDSNDEHIEQCCSCKTILKENEILCYPLYMYSSTLPLKYDNYGNVNYVKCFTLCTHLIHQKCGDNTVCPIDRYFRNLYLPKIENRNDLYNEKDVIENVNEFVANFDDLNQIFLAFCSIIVLYEVRLRNNSQCLNNKKYFDLVRNFFLALKVIYHSHKNFNVITYSIFQSFILDLIKCDSPETKINEIINKNIINLKDKELNLFLRRIKLTEIFALNDNFNYDNLINELTNKDLCNKYNIVYNGNEYVFDPYKLISMPKNFLHFALEPFNLYHELVTTETECFICLNDSKVIETELNDDLKELFNDSFDQFHLIMNLNIKQTRIYFVLHMDDSPVPYFFKVPPVYLDELGNVQIGFGFYGFEIFLSDERLEKLADDFISGEIMKYAAFDDE